MKILDNIIDFILEPPAWATWLFYACVEVFIIGSIAFFFGLLFAKGILDDNEQLLNDEISPHSGFCPDYPEWKGGEK